MEKLVTFGMPNPIVQLTQFTGGSDVARRLLELTGGRCKIEDAGFDWKILGPDVPDNPKEILEVAKTCDRDAYAASGQKCSAQSILFAHGDWMKINLVETLKNLALARKIDNLSAGPLLTWNNGQIKEHIKSLLSIRGAEVLFGGKPLSDKHSIPECYGSFEPTAVFVPLSEIINNFKLVTTEIFGPFQIITEWEGEEGLNLVLKICEKIENHLTAGVVSNDPEFLNYVLGRTVNGITYAGIRGRTTGAPEWHFFGPTGHPASAGIGTPEGIISTWSQNRTINFDTKEL